MAHQYTLHRRQRLPLPLAETFAFFERPENLARITPGWLEFRVLTPEPIVMAADLVLDCSIRVFGVRTHWRSRIAEYDPPHAFRDVQVIGPYRLWDHRHRFWSEGDGTVMEDLVRYEMPFGLLGRIAHRLLTRRQLEAIFDYRRERIQALLSGEPAALPDQSRI